MAITMYERPESRPFEITANSETLTIQYFLTGTNSDDEVYEHLIASTPIVRGRMARQRITTTSLSGGHWFADVVYSSTIDASDPASNGAVGSEPPEAGPSAPSATEALGSAFSLDTTGGTVHITQAISTRLRQTATGNNGPDEKLAIGLTKDRVEGTDIYAPALTFSRTVQRAIVSMQYLNLALYGLVGRTNNAPFYGFAAGEVLYLGCSGNYTAKDKWSLTHKFACQPNETDLVVSRDSAGVALITVPVKKGWDYVWCAYEPAKQNNQILQTPKVAYVQQVYKEGNFGLLEIGA